MQIGVKNQNRKLKFGMRDAIELSNIYSGFLKMLKKVGFMIALKNKVFSNCRGKIHNVCKIHLKDLVEMYLLIFLICILL